MAIERDSEIQGDYHKTLWNRLKKFKSLSTGIKDLDQKILESCGPWLSPKEEYEALRGEISRLETLKQDCEELKARLKDRIRRGIEVKEDFQTDYQVKITHVPFETEEGDLAFMPLRQLFIWIKPVDNSGRLRITYLKRFDKFSIIDAETKKRVDQVDHEGLARYLIFFFSTREVDQMYQDLMES